MNKMQTIHPWLVWRRKILMTMKLGVCFLLCTVFQVSARVTAQNERMNFKMHDASLKTILWALEKKSEMFFFYSVKDIEQVTGIDVVAENKTLDEILSEVLKNTGITYEVTHNTVVLRKGKVNAALPQSKTSEVTGKVTDRSGSPLPGVTILIKGTSLGTVTDTEGIFKIALPQKKDVVLVFSFIGMKTQEIVLKDDKPLKVVMQEDAKEIDEVVVTGIFNRKKDSFTGASATFDGEQLRSVGTQNVIASLKTLDPSFNVLENNEFGSDPNKLPDIEIRGKSSLISTRDELSEDPNQPLFILDGFESSLEAIYNLDMSRVASITILKDAAATANQIAGSLGIPTDSFEVNTVGPDWGAGVIQSSAIAFAVSLLLIIAYIAIRFEYKMGIMAVVALLHDLIIVVGIYALVGREITPNMVAALLTILGYSLYDTVVVFHRINDNMKESSLKCTFMSMANHSINQVFIRTINTTLTSFVPVFGMLLFGGETLKDFAFAMAVGLIAGSYSSIAVATPLYAMWKTREEKNAKLVKKYGPEVQLFTFASTLPPASNEEAKAAVAAGEAAANKETVAVETKAKQTSKAKKRNTHKKRH